MLSARELRYRYSGKRYRLSPIPGLIAFKNEWQPTYVPVSTETMLPEFLEANVSELPWILVKPETPQLFCNCMHPSCCRDHGYAK